MIDPQRNRIEEIFHAAREQPPERRADFVDAECGDDTRLRDAVRELLGHHERAEHAFTPIDTPVPEPETPSSIGPFQILRTLGEGGMGTVYLARQQEPFDRQVALKVIRPGMDSRQILTRFQAEQQALASLDHPSIASVFATGTTDDGRPYFVMEYVDGQPITAYCDGKRLSFADRIALFLQVCQAIQHAHQKGIIHRDIKPGNVIVTDHEGIPLPKVIDFGIAKATESGLLPGATLTQEGQLVGTLEYMSPEQAAALDVDTRTDVYALGLLLYELLVGAPPFDAQLLRRRGLDEMIRTIRDTEPPRPSARWNTLGDTAAEQASHRQTDPRAVMRMLRGDLDWIVMKALEKDRDRRYSSAAGFAADLGRYLHSEPVEARPPSTLYRVGKFARRHRVGVSLASLLILSLIAISAITLWQSARVARERDRAHRQSRISDEVASYLGDIFHRAATAHGFPDSVRLLEAMALGVDNISTADVSPQARIRILRIMADAYIGMTRLGEAQPVVRKLVQLSVEQYGEDHLETAQGRFLLLSVHRQLGQLNQALELALQVLPVFERDLGPDNPQTLRCVWFLAGIYGGLGRAEASLAHFDRLESAYRRTLGEDHPRLGMLYNEMAPILAHLGRYEEAEQTARRSVAILEARYGARSPMVMLPLDALSSVLALREDYFEALAMLDRSSELARESYGDAHPETRRMQAARGWILLAIEQYDSAYAAFEDAMNLPETMLEWHKADPLLGLGIVERKLGDLDASGRDIRHALDLLRQLYGDRHSHVARALTAWGETELEAGHVELADSLLEAAVTMARDVLPPGHPTTAMSELALGHCQTVRHRFAEAEPLLLHAHERLSEICAPTSRRLERAETALANLYDAWNRPAEAARYR